MIKDKYGDKLDQWIRTIFPFLFKRPIDPNLLTIIGAGVCVAAAVAFGPGQFVQIPASVPAPAPREISQAHLNAILRRLGGRLD